jgi:hypothetical protein
MLWPLTRAVILGTLPGVFIGAWVRIEYLPDPTHFKFFAGFVLLYIGWRLLLDLLRKNRKGSNKKPTGNAASHDLRLDRSSWREVAFTYDGDAYGFSPALVYGICFLVGIAGGIYGIGGGSIVAPFFVAIIGLPVYVVAGAALMGTFITSVAGVVFYQALARVYPDIPVAPDWRLGLLFGLGGVIGMYLGARTQRFVPAGIIKAILCACVLLVAGKYIWSFFAGS